MKCRVCGESASINLKAYNTALCARDFTAFLEKRVLKTIQRYKLITEKDVPIVAVSGGKDSLSLWYILNKLGYLSDGIYIDLNIEGYSDLSFEKIKMLSDKLKRRVYIFHLRDIFENGIDELSRKIRRSTCSACGMIKRYIMNRVCIEKGYNLLITGHNLDDEASALLGNMLYWKDEYLFKKNLSLDESEGHLSKKVKPLFLCSEREMAAYAIICQIDYIQDECPFSRDAKSLLYKDILNGLEDSSPGTKLQFIKGYLKALRLYGRQRDKDDAGYCSVCGYPAYSDICNFCRMRERFGAGVVKFEEYGTQSDLAFKTVVN